MSQTTTTHVPTISAKGASARQREASKPAPRQQKPVEGLTLGELVMEMYWNYQHAVETDTVSEVPVWKQQLRDRARLDHEQAQQRSRESD